MFFDNSTIIMDGKLTFYHDICPDQSSVWKNLIYKADQLLKSIGLSPSHPQPAVCLVSLIVLVTIIF